MAAELFTLAECKQILDSLQFKEFHLINYEIVTDNEALGFLGEYYRLILLVHCQDVQEVSKLSFFVKSMSQQSAELEKIKIFRKEAELYATLLKDLQIYSNYLWSPKCYFTRSDLMVLQDLKSLNYENCHHNDENLITDELKALLSAMSKLHASSILLEEQHGSRIDKLYSSSMLEEITVSPNVTWFTIGLKTILDLAKIHHSYQSSEVQNFISNHFESRLSAVYEMQNPSKKYRNVLCHRDLWRANVLFNYSDMSAVLVDFQTCIYCPPSIDLVVAIFINQTPESRNAFEEKYLLWYYEKFKWELTQHQIDAGVYLSYDELKASYEDFKLFGLLYKAMTMTITGVPKEMVTNDYKYVDRTKELVNLMKSNVHFCNRMNESISELLDYVMSRENKGK